MSSDTVLEGRYRTLVGASVRVKNTRGLEFGTELAGDFYPIKDRTTENYGEPTRLRNGVIQIHLSDSWELENSFIALKTTPLAATILAIVVESEFDDT